MRFGLLGIKIGPCADPVIQAAVRAAVTTAAIARSLGYPMVRGERLEASVRAIGAEFVRA